MLFAAIMQSQQAGCRLPSHAPVSLSCMAGRHIAGTGTRASCRPAFAGGQHCRGAVLRCQAQPSTQDGTLQQPDESQRRTGKPVSYFGIRRIHVQMLHACMKETHACTFWHLQSCMVSRKVTALPQAGHCHCWRPLRRWQSGSQRHSRRCCRHSRRRRRRQCQPPAASAACRRQRSPASLGSPRAY